MERIGIVGVGRMGANMARRLHQVGYQITAIYDTYEPSAKALANELNTTACKTLAEVTALADVILTVVTDDKAQITLLQKKMITFSSGPAVKFLLTAQRSLLKLTSRSLSSLKKQKPSHSKPVWLRASIRHSQALFI